MENLNKNQLILLVLLVTFITSIATGIMTSTLLQQAPVEVTRNINSVVERTIEKVVPSGITSAINSSPTITTVVVKEEDSIINSINKNVKSIVRIKETDSLGVESFYGIGVVLTADGIMVSDRKTISADSIYTVTMSDNSNFKIVPLGISQNTGSILFEVNLPPKTKYDFSPAKVSATDLQLGQTVIGLGGQNQNTVVVGRVSSLDMKESGTGTSTVKYISAVESDVSSKDLMPGSPFFNLSGDLVGIKLSEAQSGTFTPITIINKEVSLIQSQSQQ